VAPAIGRGGHNSPLAQLDKHLKIKLVVRQVEAPPQCFSAIADAIHRVLLIGDRVAESARCRHPLAARGQRWARPGPTVWAAELHGLEAAYFSAKSGEHRQ
jgi:hypothetical protein